MTWTAPADHLLAPGLWFAWNFLDGVDFWGHDVGNIGTIQLGGRSASNWASTRASVRTSYRYVSTDGAPILDEQREVVIHAPDGQGCTRLDWAQAFTPTKTAPRYRSHADRRGGAVGGSQDSRGARPSRWATSA